MRGRGRLPEYTVTTQAGVGAQATPDVQAR
jgi:hypothetical protein